MFFYLMMLFLVALMMGLLAHPAWLIVAALSFFALLGIAALNVWGILTGRHGFLGHDPEN